MPILVSDTQETEYEPTPTGLIKAILVNVIPIGLQEGFGGKIQDKVVFLWEVETLKEDGSHFLVTKEYTRNLGEKANLRKDLKSWRGKDFEPEELKCFDLEKTIYKPCQLNLVQKGKWVNVDSVLPASKDAYWSPVTKRDYIPNFVKKWIDEQLVGNATEKQKQQLQDDIKSADPGIF